MAHRRQDVRTGLILPIFLSSLLAPAGATAAPAPFPKPDRGVTWELVLVAPTESVADEAHCYLRSRLFFSDLADAEPVRLALPHADGQTRLLRVRRVTTVRFGGDYLTARVRVHAEAALARAVLDAVAVQVASPPA